MMGEVQADFDFNKSEFLYEVLMFNRIFCFHQ